MFLNTFCIINTSFSQIFTKKSSASVVISISPFLLVYNQFFKFYLNHYNQSSTINEKKFNYPTAKLLYKNGIFLIVFLFFYILHEKKNIKNK